MAVSKKQMDQRLVELSALMRNNGVLRNGQRISYTFALPFVKKKPYQLIIVVDGRLDKYMTGPVAWGTLCDAVEALEELGINGQEMRA